MTPADWLSVAAHAWWIFLALAVVIGADVRYARSERRSGE